MGNAVKAKEMETEVEIFSQIPESQHTRSRIPAKKGLQNPSDIVVNNCLSSYLV